MKSRKNDLKHRKYFQKRKKSKKRAGSYTCFPNYLSDNPEMNEQRLSIIERFEQYYEELHNRLISESPITTIEEFDSVEQQFNEILPIGEIRKIWTKRLSDLGKYTDAGFRFLSIII